MSGVLVKTDVELCRQNGWDVGTLLIGDEGYGPSVIMLTYVSDETLLAKRVYPSKDRESSWTLSCREWQRLPDTLMSIPDFAAGFEAGLQVAKKASETA